MRILIVGGGICGLGMALLLARDRHEVTLLERDAAPIPESPEAAWERFQSESASPARRLTRSRRDNRPHACGSHPTTTAVPLAETMSMPLAWPSTS